MNKAESYATRLPTAVFASKIPPKYITGAVTAAVCFLVSWVKGRLRSV